MSKKLEKYAKNLTHFVLTHDEDDDEELISELHQAERQKRITVDHSKKKHHEE